MTVIEIDGLWHNPDRDFMWVESESPENMVFRPGRDGMNVAYLVFLPTFCASGTLT